MTNELFFMTGFIIFIVTVLLIDLLYVGRNSHEVTIKEATVWSIIWITLALLFALFLQFYAEKVHGIENMTDLSRIVHKYAPELKFKSENYDVNLLIYRSHMTITYLTGYLIEKTLSVDNLFVMLLILTGFSVKKTAYKPVLFWGILGAIVLRFIFIFAGAALIQRFEWILMVFGAYLVYAGIKMFIDRNKKETIEPQHHPFVKFLSKYLKVFPRYVGNRFFIRKDKITYITPLFIVLMFIEFTDVIFATDSIPAIFSITRDPYIVLFSNVFAILGLRSLFFLLVHIVDKFRYLKVGIAFLLAYVGVKLLLHEWLDNFGFKSVYSLYIILGVIALSVVLSFVIPPKKNQTQ